MPGWENIAMQGAGQVVGAGMGLLLGGIERKKQLEQQRKLQALQIAGQQEMGDYNMRKQLELWEATGYGAQKEQIKAAGLNPALMYGMGGGGGQTASIQTGNVAGANARQGGEAAAMGIAMGDAALKAAQIENIKAQTEKTKAETGNVPITAKNIEANTRLLEIQSKLREGTYDYDKTAAYEAMVQLGQQNRILSSQADVAEGTQKTQIEQQQQDLIKTGVEIALAVAHKNKTEAEITNMAALLQNEINKLKNETDKTKIQQQLANWETSWGKQVSQLLGNLIGVLPAIGKGIETKRK